MARVFISYATSDLVWAQDVHDWLDAAGHEVFLDRHLTDGIRAGEVWEQRLHERLRWADALVCLVTNASVSSVWCVCEVSTARSRGCRLIPVLVEPGARHPLLSSQQHIDVNADADAARKKLVEALRIVDVGGGSGWPDDQSPFPGLRPFTTDQHRVFFGRRAEVNQLAEALRSPAERADAAVLRPAPEAGFPSRQRYPEPVQ